MNKKSQASNLLNARKIRRCEDFITENYEDTSIVKDAVNHRTYDKNSDKNVEFVDIAVRSAIDKFWFSDDPRYVPDFGDIGRSVAIGEEKYLTKRLMESVSNRTEIEALTVSEFKSVVTLMRRNGLNPTVLFAPIKNYMALSLLARYEDRKEFLAIDDLARMQIFWSSKYVELDEFILLDKSFGEWIVRPDEKTGKYLSVRIEGMPKESKVDMTVKTTVSFLVKNKDAAMIVHVG
jgi:hypothetical protein